MSGQGEDREIVLVGRDGWGRIWVDKSDPEPCPESAKWEWVEIDAPLNLGMAELTACRASRGDHARLFFQRLAETGEDAELRAIVENWDPAKLPDCLVSGNPPEGLRARLEGLGVKDAAR